MDAQPLFISLHDESAGYEISPDRVPLAVLRTFVKDVEEFLRGDGGEVDLQALDVGVVKGSLAHFLNFTVEKEGDYELYFTMSSGWAAVILGNVKIRKADTSTGITDCTIDAFGKANIITYNLSGQRISAQTKGLVIEQILFANGKKVSRKVIKK